MGLEANGIFDHINKATLTGINNVFQLILAALAELITGATIKATTAGLIPLNMAETTGLFLMISGVRKMAMANIIVKEGSMVPKAAHMEPLAPRSLSPTATDIFTASIPGSD